MTPSKAKTIHKKYFQTQILLFQQNPNYKPSIYTGTLESFNISFHARKNGKLQFYVLFILPAQFCNIITSSGKMM